MSINVAALLVAVERLRSRRSSLVLRDLSSSGVPDREEGDRERGQEDQPDWERM
jgi:hypothetical protein